MELKSREAGGGRVEGRGDSWKLWIPSGTAGQYRLAQIDDYAGRRRRTYPWQPPISIQLVARISSRSIPGTWGFGLWNDPFGLSLGGGSELLRLPALPQSAWFFGASNRSYLSLRDDMPACGFYAQVLRSTPRLGQLALAGLTLPFRPRDSRRRLSQVMEEDGRQIGVPPETWHTFRIEWEATRTTFCVDEQVVLRSQVAPRATLGMVVWIDNQYAAFPPSGKPSWGVEASDQPDWLEVREIRVTGGGAAAARPTA